ncbi:MAG: M6 family metalloprotease domain-containing protein, partial [FCB group bacterium]|nr:M6 family metalloprotease domain-containing protein [FCB group bacterium]
MKIIPLKNAIRRFFQTGLIIAVSILFLSSSIYAVSASPKLLQKLRSSGDLQKFVTRIASAKARGAFSPLNSHFNLKSKFSKNLAASPQTVDTFKVIVILADFSDNPATSGKIYGQPADFQNLLFSFDSTDNIFSMTEFYFENSYGSFYIQGTVVGWIRLPQTYSYYVNGQNGFGSYPHNAQKMAEDAITLADPSVDYAQFDNDNNGWCDGVFIVHAGPGAEETGSDDMIWSHSWNTSYTLNLDGINISSYTTEPEEMQKWGLITMGVFAHEYGHFLGLPDLYDTDYSSAGIGDWSLMAGGSWNYNGSYPAFFDAWCKKELGFLNLSNFTSDQLDVEVPA